MAHIQGHAAVIVGDPALEQEGLVEVDEVGIPAEGLREDVGLKDGCCILKGDKLHELLMGGDHGPARDAPADHGDLSSDVFLHVFGLDGLKPVKPRRVEGEGMGADEKPEGFGLVAELGLVIISLQGRHRIVRAVKGKQMPRGASSLDHGGVASCVDKKDPHDLGPAHFGLKRAESP